MQSKIEIQVKPFADWYYVLRRHGLKPLVIGDISGKRFMAQSIIGGMVAVKYNGDQLIWLPLDAVTIL